MIKQDVLGLDISMDDELFMNVINSLADLPDDRGNISLLHPSFASQLLQELAVWAEFNKQINVLFV